MLAVDLSKSWARCVVAGTLRVFTYKCAFDAARHRNSFSISSGSWSAHIRPRRRAATGARAAFRMRIQQATKDDIVGFVHMFRSSACVDDDVAPPELCALL